MPDVYNTNVNMGEGWKLDGAIIQFGKAPAEGEAENTAAQSGLNGNIVATSLTMNYQRSTEQINPINSTKRYVIASDAQGTLQIGAVVGPSSDMKLFIKTFGDVCNIGNTENPNMITIRSTGTQKCPGKQFTSKTWICKGCLITNVNLNIQKTQGGNMVMSNISMSFLSLEIPDED